MLFLSIIQSPPVRRGPLIHFEEFNNRGSICTIRIRTTIRAQLECLDVQFP